MKVRLLKRLRKEAYKEHGIAEIITRDGLIKFIVGRRRYIKDYNKWWGCFNVCDFLPDAKRHLAIYRRVYIQTRVEEIRRERLNIFISVRNKTWKKL